MSPATAAPPPPVLLPPLALPREAEPGPVAGDSMPFDHVALRALLQAKTVDLGDIAWEHGLSLDALMDIMDGRAAPPADLRARWEREMALRSSRASR